MPIGDFDQGGEHQRRLLFTIQTLEFMAYPSDVPLDDLVTEPLSNVTDTPLWLARQTHRVKIPSSSNLYLIRIAIPSYKRETALVKTVLNLPVLPLLITVLLECQTEFDGVHVRPDPRERFSSVLRRFFVMVRLIQVLITKHSIV
jgi:hypothetical protein